MKLQYIDHSHFPKWMGLDGISCRELMDSGWLCDPHVHTDLCSIHPKPSRPFLSCYWCWSLGALGSDPGTEGTERAHKTISITIPVYRMCTSFLTSRLLVPLPLLPIPTFPLPPPSPSQGSHQVHVRYEVSQDSSSDPKGPNPIGLSPENPQVEIFACLGPALLPHAPAAQLVVPVVLRVT